MTLRLVIPRRIIGSLHESAPVSFAGLEKNEPARCVRIVLQIRELWQSRFKAHPDLLHRLDVGTWQGLCGCSQPGGAVR